VEEFIKWLTEQMQEMSQAELARQSGLSQGLISQILSGQRKPGVEACAGFSRAFRLPTEDVMRLAGLLPARMQDILNEDTTLSELFEVARSMNQAERRELLRYALYRKSLSVNGEDTDSQNS
jgi:transcriptional regulator with XRE-family HTH domain